MPRVALDLNRMRAGPRLAGRGGGRWGWCLGSRTRGWWLRSSSRRPVEGLRRLVVGRDNQRARAAVEGLTFAWWRDHGDAAGGARGHEARRLQLRFETNVDNYGEIFVDGEIDSGEGVVVGFDSQQRDRREPSVTPGAEARHRGAGRERAVWRASRRIFLRYATLAFETRGG